MFRTFIYLLAIALLSPIVSAAAPKTKSQDFLFSNQTPYSLKTQIIADFTALKTIQGSKQSPLHQQIFGGNKLDGSRYQKFIQARVEEFEFWPSDHGVYLLSAGAIEGEQKVYISARYFGLADKIPTVMRQALLVHEARHNEAENEWSHSPCPTPFLDSEGKAVLSILDGEKVDDSGGSSSCETDSFGAYSITVVMARNIQKFCTSCSEEVKKQAGEFADNMLQRIINPEAKATLIKDSESL